MGEVDAVNIKLPAFWSNDPELWFTQIEAIFTSRNITTDATKYGHLVGALPAETAVQVRDILLNPPAAGTRFVNLKTELIKRTTDSDQQRIKQLLTVEELDGRRPTQLLRRMRQLAGTNGAITDELLKQLFIPRLPANVQVALTAHDSLTVDQMAVLADRMVEVSIPHINAVESNEVAELRRELAEIKTLLRSRSAERGPQAGRSRTKTPPRVTFTANESEGLCWFHSKFGNQAKKCRQPCSYRPGN